MYLLRRVSGASFPTIGEHFSRNHSTVIYAVALIERRMERDAAFRQFVEELEAQIPRPTTTTDRFDRRTAGAESDGHSARDIGTINSHRHLHQHKATFRASIEKLQGRLNSRSTEAAA